MRYFILTLLLFTISSGLFALEPQAMLAQTFNSPSISEHLKEIEKKDSGTFIFQPNIKSIKLDYKKAGVSMEYNSAMMLYRMTMYDKGYTYQRYELELPFQLSWQMKASEIEAKIGALESVDDNPFKRLYSTKDHIIELFFTDNKLDLVRINATKESLTDNYEKANLASGPRLYPNGTKVEGNIIDGIGTMQWRKSGSVYKGQWAYGLPHGFGSYVDTSGTKYEGGFILGYFWGKGKFFSKTANISYSGDFVMSKRHGNGQIQYSKTQAYEGEFFQDYMHGKGSYVMGKNMYYEGEMVYNTVQGKGVLKTTYGTVEGSFQNGKPHGICEQMSFDGAQSLKGNWVVGKKEGEFEFVQNGITTKRYFTNDIEMKSGPIDSTLPK